MRGLKVRGLAAVVSMTAVVALCAASPALADPRRAPTESFIMDVEVTRPTDHTLRAPMRYVSVGKRFRIEYNGLATLYDVSRRTYEVMIPRVRVAARAQPLAGPVNDNRRWIGVEANTAERIASETMLGRPVTKYRVTGTMFEPPIPFEGDVWTTAENIVVKAVGTSKTGREGPQPVEVTAVQIAVGGVDASLVQVPKNYRRAEPEEVYTDDDK
jgi:hypothetical protein